MRKIWGIFLAAAVLLSGCKRYDPVETTETPPPVVVQEKSTGHHSRRTRAARETACESKRNLFICPCGGK